jgi:RNA polymerase sigma-70 factor (ECF subfamily)
LFLPGGSTRMSALNTVPETRSRGSSRVAMSVETSHLPSEEELVTRAQCGDGPAMNLLISTIRPRILSYCRSRLASYSGGWDAADDAAQETCAAVVHVLPGYQHQGAPFIAFVYAIAANKVVDAQRRYSRSAICVDDLPEQVEPSPTPEEHAISSAIHQAVTMLLDQLPERMRKVLVLRATGASAHMVGEELGMSANAVRVAQHRAAAKLRQLIEQSDDHRELLSGPVYSHRAA